MELHASNYSAATMLRTKIPICKCSAVIAMLASPNATDVASRFNGRITDIHMRAESICHPSAEAFG
jgi:hypothetical protein